MNELEECRTGDRHNASGVGGMLLCQSDDKVNCENDVSGHIGDLCTVTHKSQETLNAFAMYDGDAL